LDEQLHGTSSAMSGTSSAVERISYADERRAGRTLGGAGPGAFSDSLAQRAPPPPHQQQQQRQVTSSVSADDDFASAPRGPEANPLQKSSIMRDTSVRRLLKDPSRCV